MIEARVSKVVVEVGVEESMILNRETTCLELNGAQSLLVSHDAV